MLNKNLDLNIEDYVTVDFKAMADAVDLLGGIEVDVTEAEAEELNHYVDETAMVAGKNAEHIEAGLQTLDGVQAVTYARIRKNVGGDYGRTERQRLVIQKMAEKAKKMDLTTLNNMIDEIFPQVSTSFTMKELFSLATGALQYELGETSGFAFEYTDGSMEGVGSIVAPLGLKENVEELHGFLYPKQEYVVSDTVVEISQQIESTTGYTREDYVSTEE